MDRATYTYQLLNSQSIIRNPGKVESLTQTCRKLIRRLVFVPNFNSQLHSMMANEYDCTVSLVYVLWAYFKRGDSLLAIYNASLPEEGDLTVAVDIPKDKMAKTAALLFITACIQSTNIPVFDIFTLSDLYGSHMIGFVKVVKTVVDLLASRGYPLISESNDTDDLRQEKYITRREYIIIDLVESERQYVHHMMNILYLRNELRRTLSAGSLLSIFMNIDDLADLALRFLVQMEQLYYLEDEMQNFGDLFVRFKDAFRHNEFFIATQQNCQETCRKEWGVIVSTIRSTTLGQCVLAHPKFLLALLLKPLQRLFKYQMLLKDLMNETVDIEMRADLAAAIKIFEKILRGAIYIDHEALRAATQGFIDGTVHMEADQHVVVPQDADASSISDSLRPVSMDNIPPPPYFLAHRPDSLAEMRGSHFQ